MTTPDPAVHDEEAMPPRWEELRAEAERLGIDPRQIRNSGTPDVLLTLLADLSQMALDGLIAAAMAEVVRRARRRGGHDDRRVQGDDE